MHPKPVALVTGIEGFTGRYIAAELERDGYQVHGLARDGASRLGMSVADLGDLNKVVEIVSQVRPNVVIHLAGISHVAHADVYEIYKSNIMGTRNLLDALASQADPLRAVLIPSSAHVYGASSEGVLNEQSPFSPHNDYAVSKVAMEYMVRLWMDRLPIIITRPFNYTGVGQSSTFVIPKIVDHALRGESKITLGNLDVARDFMDVRDVATCYARLVAAAPVGKTVNVCSGRKVSLGEVLHMVSEMSGVDFDITTAENLKRANEVRSLQGSNAHLLSLIGPFQFRPLYQTLGWMLAGN